MAEKPKTVRPKAEKQKIDDKNQAERFKEAARQLEVDESGEKFEEAFKKISPPKKPKHDLH